jgi:hypothetical protein
MKNLILAALIVLGIYWLIDHHAPWPLSHDSLGLYNHTAHRIVGVICFALAGFLAWRWKLKK